MNIKTWQEREGVPADTQGHTLDHCVAPAMQAEIDELRAALKAQPVQEPVAWANDSWLSNPYGGHFRAVKSETFNRPLYAAPVQPVQPAPLTDEQIDELEDAR